MRQSRLVVTGTGLSMMPILPRLGDTGENLEATIPYATEHGGCSVIAGGLILADQQRDCFPDLLPLYEEMYLPPQLEEEYLRP